jgi:putative DNA primase/helicase
MDSEVRFPCRPRAPRRRGYATWWTLTPWTVQPPPTNEQDLVISAKNNHVVAFDNLSEFRPWLSDALCRVATGGGLSKRKLYTDDEEMLLKVRRPVLLNGISSEMINRPDLLDRSLLIEVPLVSDARRCTEEEVWKRLEEARPRLLGALLDAVVMALRRQGQVKLSRMPRMADFVMWVEASSPALGWKDGEFAELYFELRNEADYQTLSLWSIMEPLERVLKLHGRAYEGTISELLKELRDGRSMLAWQLPADWPKTARALGGQLKHYAPLLRRIGIEITVLPRTNKGKKVRITQKQGAHQPSQKGGPAKSEQSDHQ